eukprot:scaffold63302_cov51-Phaeocystis_antarctica.AAC.1
MRRSLPRNIAPARHRRRTADVASLMRAAHLSRRRRPGAVKVSSAAVSRGESSSPSWTRLRRGRAGAVATVAAAAAPRAARAATGSTVEKPFLLGPSSR